MTSATDPLLHAVPSEYSLHLMVAYLMTIAAVGIGVIYYVRTQMGDDKNRDANAARPQQQQQPARQRRGMQRGMQQLAAQQAQEQPQQPPPDAGPSRKEERSTKYEERLAQRERERNLKESQEEAARQAVLAKERADLDAEFDQWKGQIVEEGKGEQVDDGSVLDGQPGSALLEQFIAQIKMQKMVPVEDLAVQYGMGSAQAVIERITDLESVGRLSGVLDDRGKYIYVAPESLDNVTQWMKSKGRVNLGELVAACNRLLDVQSELPEVLDNKDDFLDIFDIDEKSEQ